MNLECFKHKNETATTLVDQSARKLYAESFEYCFKLIQVRLLDSLVSLLFGTEDRDLVAVPVGLGGGKWSMMVKITENRGLGSWHRGIVPLVLRHLPHLPKRKIVPLKWNKYSTQPFQWKGVTIYSSCDLFLSLL